MRVTKAISYAFATSPNAERLGFADTGCWHISQTYWNIEGSDQCRTFVPHDAEGFLSPDHPDLISVYGEYEGDMCPSFQAYGNEQALAALA